MTELLAKVKVALRIVTNDYDGEITDLIHACLLDLGFAGVTNDDTTNYALIRAIITYCRMNFGEPSDYERLKKSYDELKATMGVTTGYTTWTDQA